MIGLKTVASALDAMFFRALASAEEGSPIAYQNVDDFIAFNLKVGLIELDVEGGESPTTTRSLYRRSFGGPARVAGNAPSDKISPVSRGSALVQRADLADFENSSCVRT